MRMEYEILDYTEYEGDLSEKGYVVDEVNDKYVLTIVLPDVAEKDDIDIEVLENDVEISLPYYYEDDGNYSSIQIEFNKKPNIVGDDVFLRMYKKLNGE